MVGARGPLSKRQSAAVLKRLAAQAPDTGSLERHLAVEQAVAESPLFTGNEVKILRDGAQTFPAMFAAIRGAQHYLYLEYYIFEDVSCNGEQLEEICWSQERRQGANPPDLRRHRLDRHAGGFSRAAARPRECGSCSSIRRIRLRGGGHFSLNDRDHRKMRDRGWEPRDTSGE